MNDDDRPADTVLIQELGDSLSEELGDSLTQELRDSLSELALPQPPPLAAITSRGRLHRRRRRLAGLCGTGAAALIALVLGLTGAFAAVTGTGTTGTAAFSVTNRANGTVSLRLGQVFDPAALQRALGQHGIRALVKTNIYCSSSPAPTNPLLGRVLPGLGRPPRGVRGILITGNFPVKPSQLAPFVDPVTVVIKPAAMPHGTELFIGYFDLGHTVSMDLIDISGHTCRTAQDPPGAPWLKKPPAAKVSVSGR